ASATVSARSITAATSSSRAVSSPGVPVWVCSVAVRLAAASDDGRLWEEGRREVASTDADPGNRYDAGPRETGDPAARTVPVSRIVVVLAVVIPLIMLAVVLVMVRSVGDE